MLNRDHALQIARAGRNVERDAFRTSYVQVAASNIEKAHVQLAEIAATSLTDLPQDPFLRTLLSGNS